jgi:hypothetical protein
LLLCLFGSLLPFYLGAIAHISLDDSHVDRKNVHKSLFKRRKTVVIAFFFIYLVFQLLSKQLRPNKLSGCPPDGVFFFFGCGMKITDNVVTLLVKRQRKLFVNAMQNPSINPEREENVGKNKLNAVV